MPIALRAVLIVIFLLGILISIGDLVAASPPNSAFAFDMTQIPGRRDTYRVDDLRGLTARDGRVSPGDELRLLDTTPANRLLVTSPGVPVRFLDLRTAAPVTLVDTLPRRPAAIAWKILRVAIEITALLLLILRGSMVPAVGLASFLFLSQFTLAAMTGAYLGAPWRTTYEVIQGPLTALAQIGLIVLAAGFAPESRSQRFLVRSLIALVVLWIVVDVALDLWALAGEPYVAPPPIDRVLLLLTTLAALALFARGIVRSQGAQRRRLVVSGLSVAVGTSVSLYGFFGPNLYNVLQTDLTLIASVVMTIGLAYAILVDRMFDFAFVINRAVVFGSVSAFVIAIFILTEWLLGKEAAQVGRAQGLIEMGLALIVGLTLRPLHQRVDRFVDQAFFAVRHRNARAVLRFAEECYDIESRDRLLQHTVETVRRFGRVAGCSVLVADEKGDLREAAALDLHVPDLDRDHLITLRLRSSRRPLERGAGSPLDMTEIADAAFPIPGKKRLAGALLCSLPPRAEPFSPEEFGALARLAHELGAALLAIDAAEAQRLREEIALIRASTAKRRRQPNESATAAPRAKRRSVPRSRPAGE